MTWKIVLSSCQSRTVCEPSSWLPLGCFLPLPPSFTPCTWGPAHPPSPHAHGHLPTLPHPCTWGPAHPPHPVHMGTCVLLRSRTIIAC